MSHDWASAVGSDMLSKIPASTLWKTNLPRLNVPLQRSGVDGVITPSERPASATIGLKVEPVG